MITVAATIAFGIDSSGPSPAPRGAWWGTPTISVGIEKVAIDVSALPLYQLSSAEQVAFDRALLRSVRRIKGVIRPDGEPV